MEKTFFYQNSRVTYTIEGKGDVVILIHGFGEDKEIFTEQVLFLKQDCCVVTLNLPGTGDSSLLSAEQISIDDYADCVYALAQHENISRCVVLGHSMGGYITLAFAEKYPDTLAGFGLIHSTAFADSSEKKEVRKRGIEAIREYGAYAFLKNTISNLFSASFKQTNPEAVTALIEKGKNFTTEALVQYYTAMMNRVDRTSVLKSADVPVLFIIGTEDVAAPLNDLLQQVHLPQVAQINILEDVGHMGLLESSDKLNNHISYFVRKLVKSNFSA